MKILDSIFPIHCIWCWIKWNYLCDKCKNKLVRHKEICPVCHNFSSNFKVCPKCQNKVYYNWIYIIYNYSWLIKKLILNLKYLHYYDIWWFLSQEFQKNFLKNLSPEKTIITFVPSHWIRKFWIKWYNQSQILAQNLAKKYWLNFLQITKKIKYTQSQTRLNRNQRLHNLKWCFEICPNIKLKWDEKIIIVDDITTTWSTINEISQTLKANYPNLEIYGLVLARNAN